MTENRKTNFDIFRKVPKYTFGLRRKKFYDMKKERNDLFSIDGKLYIVDGFLPDNTGIFATEITDNK